MDMNEEVVGISKIGYGYNIRKSTVVVLGVIGRKQPRCGVRLGELLRPISSVYRMMHWRVAYHSVFAPDRLDPRMQSAIRRHR